MQDYHQLDVWQRAMTYAVACLELCQRLYPALSGQSLDVLIDEGNQISRMTHRLIQRLGMPPGTPAPPNS